MFFEKRQYLLSIVPGFGSLKESIVFIQSLNKNNRSTYRKFMHIYKDIQENRKESIQLSESLKLELFYHFVIF